MSKSNIKDSIRIENYVSLSVPFAAFLKGFIDVSELLIALALKLFSKTGFS